MPLPVDASRILAEVIHDRRIGRARHSNPVCSDRAGTAVGYGAAQAQEDGVIEAAGAGDRSRIVDGGRPAAGGTSVSADRKADEAGGDRTADRVDDGRAAAQQRADSRPAVIAPEFVRVNDTSPVTALPFAVMVPWFVSAQPGVAAGEVTPVPAEVTVAPVTTVAVLPEASAQPAAPRTIAPFAPSMIPFDWQVACAALPRASKAVASTTGTAKTGGTSLESTVLVSRLATASLWTAV